MSRYNRDIHSEYESVILRMVIAVKKEPEKSFEQHMNILLEKSGINKDEFRVYLNKNIDRFGSMLKEFAVDTKSVKINATL